MPRHIYLFGISQLPENADQDIFRFLLVVLFWFSLFFFFFNILSEKNKNPLFT